MKKILILCLGVWIVFNSGQKVYYPKAEYYEWHDGNAYNSKDTLFNPIITNKWLILLDKKGNQIKCIQNKFWHPTTIPLIVDVLGKEAFD